MWPVMLRLKGGVWRDWATERTGRLGFSGGRVRNHTTFSSSIPDKPLSAAG